MTAWMDHWIAAWQAPGGWLSVAASLIMGGCVASVFTAVLVNFILCSRRDGVREERRSLVATGSMTAFFVAVYLLIRFRVGVLPAPSQAVRVMSVVAGLLLVVAGCVVNILGRFRLGRNWANQATIYRDQGLVTTGVYGWIRHPLYASLIWMFYGASLVYANAAVFAANTCVFVPFMIYRARLEEVLLARQFGAEYETYRRRVGMLMFRPRGLARQGRQDHE